MADIKLTPMRIRALVLIAEQPGIYIGTLAERLEYRGRYTDGSKVRGTAQGATLWGGGYSAPLVKAGLVRKDSRVDCGGARLYLTDAGVAALNLPPAAAPRVNPADGMSREP